MATARSRGINTPRKPEIINGPCARAGLKFHVYDYTARIRNVFAPGQIPLQRFSQPITLTHLIRTKAANLWVSGKFLYPQTESTTPRIDTHLSASTAGHLDLLDAYAQMALAAGKLHQAQIADAVCRRWRRTAGFEERQIDLTRTHEIIQRTHAPSTGRF